MLPISENDTLFALIGTTYGGDGQETFALPNLQGRVPIHMGTSSTGTTYVIGQAAGTESETLSVQQIPSHNHSAMASGVAGTASSPSGTVLANGSSTAVNVYLNPGVTPANTVTLNAASVAGAGGSQPHDNMGPFLTVSFIISLFGIFPQQN